MDQDKRVLKIICIIWLSLYVLLGTVFCGVMFYQAHTMAMYSRGLVLADAVISLCFFVPLFVIHHYAVKTKVRPIVVISKILLIFLPISAAVLFLVVFLLY